jgi:hypothetical protein
MPRHGNEDVCCNDKTWDDYIGYASKAITYAAAFAGLNECALKTIADGHDTIKILSTAAMAAEYVGSLCVKCGYKEGALGVSLLDGRTSGASNLRKVGLFIHLVGVVLAGIAIYKSGMFAEAMKSDPDSY